VKVLLIAYDNGSFIHHFPLGLGYIASALREAGHDVEIYNQDKNHWPDQHLATYLYHNPVDVVGLGIIAGYYQYQKILAISKAVMEARSAGVEFLYVLGGHGPSPEPEFFLKKTGADVVVLGEGERTFVELLDAEKQGIGREAVNGIYFLAEDGTGVKTAARPLISNIDGIPWPAWDLFPMDYYSLIRLSHTANEDRVAAVVSARGCPFKCNFCYRLDKGIRLRSPEPIVTEMQELRSKYGMNYFGFLDELLMFGEQRTIAVSNAIEEAFFGSVKWACNGRLNYATPKVLKAMKDSGCVEINYGVECFDDEVLRRMNKQLTTRQIEEGTKATLDSGITPTLNVMFGNLGETEETLWKTVEFMLKYDPHETLRTIRPLTPYPGSPLYYQAIEMGLLEGPEDFYENKHTNSDLMSVNFTDIPDDRFYELLLQANGMLIEKYYERQRERNEEVLDSLYRKKDASFRGFRQT